VASERDEARRITANVAKLPGLLQEQAKKPGEIAQQRSGAPDRGEYRQAARIAAWG
jgi:hypothetical protein